MIKHITAPLLAFKAFYSATATIADIEAAHIIRKSQFDTKSLFAFQRFDTLVA